MDFVTFPSMSRGDLRAMRIAIDGAFRDFTRAYGETLEQLFQPIQVLLIFIENLLIDSPWILVLAAIGGLVWGLSRSWKIVGGTVVALLMWFYLAGFSVLLGALINVELARRRRIRAAREAREGLRD